MAINLIHVAAEMQRVFKEEAAEISAHQGFGSSMWADVSPAHPPSSFGSFWTPQAAHPSIFFTKRIANDEQFFSVTDDTQPASPPERIVACPDHDQRAVWLSIARPGGRPNGLDSDLER
jgi:hypothetical protein